MKTISDTQRFLNIIARATEECGFTLDPDDSFIDIVGYAENALFDSIEYDRIEEADYWDDTVDYQDGLGFRYNSTGEHFAMRERDMHWYRKNGNSFDEIDWFEADREKDYVLAGYCIDSNAQVVLLVVHF